MLKHAVSFWIEFSYNSNQQKGKMTVVLDRHVYNEKLYKLISLYNIPL